MQQRFTSRILFVIVFLSAVLLPIRPLSAQAGCALNAQEQAFMTSMKNHPKQGRASVTCHPLLVSVARARAADMAKRDYFSHVNPDGYGPNYLVAQAGYVLPAWWDKAPDKNYIESIHAGSATANAAWESWMNSAAHKRHILGEIDFYATQTNVGVGFVADPNSRYRYYWVVITAPPQP